MGLRYKTADGSTVPNAGEVVIHHLEPDGEVYQFVLQHAKVHCIILSVRELVTRDCVVTFHRNGGHIEYPSGKRIQFVVKEGVFFVALNVPPPGTEDMFGRVISPEQGFSRHG